MMLVWHARKCLLASDSPEYQCNAVSTASVLNGFRFCSSDLLCVFSRSVVSDSLWPHGLSGSSVHIILQARILEWGVIPFSRGSFRTRVPCIAGGFFTSVTREGQIVVYWPQILCKFIRSRKRTPEWKGPCPDSWRISGPERVHLPEATQ